MGSVRTRMMRATTTTVLLLLLQVAAYRQASVPTHANTVLTDAALSLKESLALDYDVLPMFKDITFMMESLVELMPYLEEAERPVITKAYEYLLNLDFRTTLGLLKDKATKYGGDMQSKIQKYPKKLKSSLRTLKSFFAQVSTNMDNLVEASETALTHAKVVLVSVEAFRNMMKVAEPENTQPQPLKAFLHLSDIAKTVALEVTHDTTFDDTLDLVETIIPKLVAFGAGLAEIQDTPDLSRKVDQTIEKSRKAVEDLRKISTELRNAKESIKKNSLVVIDLKDKSWETLLPISMVSNQELSKYPRPEPLLQPPQQPPPPLPQLPLQPLHQLPPQLQNLLSRSLRHLFELSITSYNSSFYCTKYIISRKIS